MKNKIFTLMLSLLISFGLWLYVVTVISPESESAYSDIPVVLDGMEYLNSKNLMIVSDTNLHMDLSLRGNRADLGKLNNSNITILADLSQITTPGKHDLQCNIFYPGSIQSGMVEVLSKDPQRITVEVAERVTSNIPVKVGYSGELPYGYEIDSNNVLLDHSMVTVSGPKDVIAQVSHAEISVDLSNQIFNIVDKYPLTIYGVNDQPLSSNSAVSVNVDEIQVQVNVYRVKKVPVTVTLDYTGSGLKEGMVTPYYTPDIITLVGADAVLDEISQINLGTISLRNFTESTTISFTLSLPKGVSTKNGIQEVSVYVDLPEMSSKSFLVTKFYYENEPYGMKFRVTEPREVEVWGPAKYVEQLTAEDVLGIVDCTGLTANSGWAPAVYEVRGYEYLRTQSSWNGVYVDMIVNKP